MSNNKEKVEYIRGLSYGDYLQRVDINDDKVYEKFLGALAYVFDINPELIVRLSDYDHLWMPKIQFPCNYIQWLTMESEEREPVISIIYHLFSKSEPYYGDRYEYTDRVLKLIKDHKEEVKFRYSLDRWYGKYRSYKSSENYLSASSERLWKNADYLSNYSGIVASS